MGVFLNNEHRLNVRPLWHNLRQDYKGQAMKNHLWAGEDLLIYLDDKLANLQKLKVDCPSAIE
jgi:hypothetical protein